MLKSKYDFLSEMGVGERHFFKFNWSRSDLRSTRETIRVTGKRKHKDSNWKIRQGYDINGERKTKGLIVERLK